MESLEIGMPWVASAIDSKVADSKSENSSAPYQRDFETLPPDHAPSRQDPQTVTTAAEVRDITREDKGGFKTRKQGHVEDQTGSTEGLKRKSSQGSKKRKFKTTDTNGLLDRFGPPRQSIRTRIKLEFQTAPDPPQSVLSPTKPKNTKPAKKQKSDSTATRELATAVVVGDPCLGRQIEGDKKQTKQKKDKATRVKGQYQPVMMEEGLVADSNPSMMLTQSDIISDEIIAYQPSSLEGMGATKIESGNTGLTLEQRVLGKKRKSRKLQNVKVKQDLDKQTPLCAMSRLVAPEPIKPGIRSSTFARVMRLVAELPSVEPKPKKLKRRVPEHRPPVWAQSRQELCEALPYYRAFQSGLYLSQGVAFGYLLDGFPAPRDVCAHNARVIISHGGGHCVRPTLDDGQVLPPVLAGDQLVTDFRVATLVRAWKHRVPLVLIAGSGYEILPFKLDCSYAVLGWYWISMVWTESEPVAQGVKRAAGRDWYKRVKVRFDWVESQGTPWWEQSAGPALQEIATYREVVTSPQAKRIQVAELLQPVPTFEIGAASCLPPEHTLSIVDMGKVDSATSQGDDDSFVKSQKAFRTAKSTPLPRPPKHESSYLHDACSGLLTPPITPPIGSSDRMPSVDTAYIVGKDVMDAGELLRPRFPGDHLMAAFEDSTSGEELADPYGPIRNKCHHCTDASPTVYREGWMCLNISCTAYWMLDTSIGLLPVPAGLRLSYEVTFLAPAGMTGSIKPPYDVVPPRPKSGIPDEAGPGNSAGSRSLWRGWVCENCGRANCRFRWEVWQCLGCQKLLLPIDPYSAVIPAKALVLEKAILGDPRIDPGSGITVRMGRICNPAATVMAYTLPDSAGIVYHVVNDCNSFADGIFDRYQREAASTRVPLFQRRALNAHQIRGQLLAQHFAVNSGVSYKYNVDSCSLSFDDSPSCVIQALDAITLRTERVVGTKVEFNEVLSVLYREGQKMSWHDDGEPGLGPVVAGLSLGSSAVISWRRKSAHTNANAAFNKGIADPRKEPTPPIALSLTTSHGDIVMMQGREMQRKYVHRVIPNGFRVAATARVIGK